MTVLFRVPAGLLERVRADLRRPHRFAHERIGFIVCRVGRLHGDGLTILGAGYEAVADDDYVDLPGAGATMGPQAIRKALQLAYNQGAGDLSMIHVHMHGHAGMPRFSSVDDREGRRFVPDFFNVAPQVPHGALVLSNDMAFGLCWPGPDKEPVPIARYAIVGAPFRVWEKA